MGWLTDSSTPPRWVYPLLRRQQETNKVILEGIRIIMALVQIDQSALDGIATELGTIGDEVAKLVANPAVPLSDADVSGITSALSRVEGLLAPAPAPEPTPEPTPVPDPAPVDNGGDVPAVDNGL